MTPRKTSVQKLFSPNGWSWMPNLTSCRNYNKNAKLKKDLCRLENFELSHTGSRYKVMQNHHFLLLSLKSLTTLPASNINSCSSPQNINVISNVESKKHQHNIIANDKPLNQAISAYLWKTSVNTSKKINIDCNGIVSPLLSAYALLHCWLHL